MILSIVINKITIDNNNNNKLNKRIKNYINNVEQIINCINRAKNKLYKQINK